MTHIGLFLTNQNPLGTDQRVAIEEQVQLAHAARDAGWDSIWTGQHFLSEGVTMLQPVPFLARLAPETGDMRLGMGICLLALANPVDVAEQFASLDIITNGRLVFGVGLGYRDVEFDAFGIAKSGRVARFEENLRIVTELWSGRKVSSDVDWCRLTDVTLTTLPLQRPRPALWMAANNDSAVTRAARLADTWMINPHAAMDTVKRQLELFAVARAEAGRGPATDIPLIREVFCAPTRQEALEMAQPHLANKYQVYASWGQDKVMPGKEDFAQAYEPLSADRFIVGSPQDCAAQLASWLDLGITTFIFRTHWSGMPVQSSLQSIDLLSKEVLPALGGGKYG